MGSWRLKNFSCNVQQEPQAMQVPYLQLVFSTNWLSDLFYTDATVLDPYEPVGCFRDRKNPRALPKLVQMYTVNETDLANSLAAIIHACATQVYESGFWYFGVEFGHECWSGVNGSMTYNRHGRSDNCIFNYGVGASWAIFVYRFVEG